MKQEKEIEVVSMMIDLYCTKKHHTHKHELCEDCKELLSYVEFRRSKCPFGDNKTFCSNCRVHCYEPGHRERIRQVMRFSGPRMIFHHPIIAISHVTETLREKRKIKKEEKKKND